MRSLWFPEPEEEGAPAVAAELAESTTAESVPGSAPAARSAQALHGALRAHPAPGSSEVRDGLVAEAVRRGVWVPKACAHCGRRSHESRDCWFEPPPRVAGSPAEHRAAAQAARLAARAAHQERQRELAAAGSTVAREALERSRQNARVWLVDTGASADVHPEQQFVRLASPNGLRGWVPVSKARPRKPRSRLALFTWGSLSKRLRKLRRLRRLVRALTSYVRARGGGLRWRGDARLHAEIAEDAEELAGPASLPTVLRVIVTAWRARVAFVKAVLARQNTDLRREVLLRWRVGALAARRAPRPSAPPLSALRGNSWWQRVLEDESLRAACVRALLALLRWSLGKGAGPVGVAIGVAGSTLLLEGPPGGGPSQDAGLAGAGHA